MLQAVIFDIDGVLVDSYQAHFESWRKLTREYGGDMSEDFFARTFGRTSREILLRLWPKGLDEKALQALDRRKEAYYRQILQQNFPLMDGALELIDELRSEGFKLAVGSSGPPENVMLALEHLGKEHFSAAVSGYDVQQGKPEPEVFERAAERLDVPPHHCAVIEDAKVGIEAANRANMVSVALVSTGHRLEEYTDASPDLIVGSLRELSPSVLNALRLSI